MAQNEATRSLSRRSFLKGTLATTAIAAGSASYLTGCTPSTQGATRSGAGEETIYSGVCRGNCYGGCHLNVHVRDGKVVRTSARELPEKEWTRICAKGLSHVYRVYDPNRIKAPMLRVEGTERGDGQWEQITWDEAFKLIADKWKGYQAEFGTNSVTYWQGSGNFSYLDNATRFWNQIGAPQISTTVDTAIFYGTNKTVGFFYNFNGNEVTDAKNAKTYVIWGSNPAVSQMQGMHFITEARDSGTEIIVIDPVYTATAAKANKWIPIEPGTDGLLAMAIMNVIIDKDWQDTSFMKANTVAPFLVKAADGKYLRLSDLGRATAGSDEDAPVVTDGNGTFDVPTAIADPVIEGTFTAEGHEVTCTYTLLKERLKKFPVSMAVEKCGIPEETIVELAQKLACNKPSTIYIALGIDHYTNGGYSLFDITSIGALTGSSGIPGGSCGTSEQVMGFFTNVAGKYGSMSKTAIGIPYQIPAPYMSTVMEKQEFLGKPIHPKSMYIYRANPLAVMANRKDMKNWMSQLEFIVTADIAMTETTRYSDLVLPVCHWFEMEDAAANAPQNPFIEFQDKCIDPLYESKSDFDIFKGIAQAMGFGNEFDFDVKDYFNDIFSVEPFASAGFSYDALKEKKAIRAVPGSSEHPFIHGEGGVYPTPTLRYQFYDENPAPNAMFGQEFDVSNDYLPYWTDAREVGLGNKKFPYQILSEHSKLRTHSQWIEIPAVLELDPEPAVRMHPDTAAERGVSEGDYVRIFNDRGSMTVLAHISSGVRPGILLCSRGWNDGQFVDGHFQDLLQNELDPLCVNQSFFDNVGDFEKARA